MGNNKGRSLVSKQGASGGKRGRFGRPFSEVALLSRTASDTGGNREFGLVRVHPVREIRFLAGGGLPRGARGRTGA